MVLRQFFNRNFGRQAKIDSYMSSDDKRHDKVKEIMDGLISESLSIQFADQYRTLYEKKLKHPAIAASLLKNDSKLLGMEGVLTRVKDGGITSLVDFMAARVLETCKEMEQDAKKGELYFNQIFLPLLEHDKLGSQGRGKVATAVLASVAESAREENILLEGLSYVDIPEHLEVLLKTPAVEKVAKHNPDKFLDSLKGKSVECIQAVLKTPVIFRLTQDQSAEDITRRFGLEQGTLADCFGQVNQEKDVAPQENAALLRVIEKEKQVAANRDDSKPNPRGYE